MTKPKNPYLGAYEGSEDAADVWKQGYAAGLQDGEQRLARALRRWLDSFDIDIVSHEDLFDWLSARQRKRKK